MKFVEHGIRSLWSGEGLAGALEFSWKGFDVVAANGVIVLMAFIRFLAFKELGRVLGIDKIRALFFQRRRPT